jgi:eukaryotic-like serine/threonine-protein kinase
MSLSQGARLGPYTIGSLLGAGGMGEVYRARDGKLNRDVAIKVLRADVVGDRERLARFEREARVLAALNHPNIANVIGLEDAGGTPALVMELVDGPTLALRIDEGPLPLEEAFEIARQIAEALEAAHDRGIVHRDLKPANVKVRPDGIVKVLDFGLAKALDPFDPQGVSDQANSPTITSPAMTMRGVILGTAAYMSPEQAKGRPVDRRADIWACGCVLYEMLTGRRAFEGEDTTETIAAVVTKEPDWTALPPLTPASIRRLLQRLLVKNPKQRVDSAAVVRLELADTTAALKGGTSERDAFTGSGARRPWPMPVLTATALLAGIGASLLTWAALPGPTRPAPAPVTRFALTLPSTQPLAQSFNASDIALSPRGAHLAYTVGLQSQLVVRALDQLDAAALEGVTGARAPFFSPDGLWIGYFDQGGELRRVSVAGGRPIAISKVDGTSRGASWGADDVIVFATSNSRGLLSVPAAGGTPTMLAAVTTGELAYFFPVVLPEGQGLIYTVVSDDGGSSIAMLDRGGQRAALLGNASQAEFVEGGYLTYAADESLWAVRFSPGSRRISGAPVRVADVPTSQVQPGVGANVAVSRHGTLAHVRAPRVQARVLAWITRSGSEMAIGAPVRRYSAPRLSPDGARLAVFLDDNDNFDIFTWDLSRESSGQTLMRVTFAPMADSYPLWSRDGRIIHSSVREGSQNIYSRSADRSGSEERLTPARTGRPLALSPDGRQLIFEQNNTDTAWDLMRLQLDGVSAPVALLRTRFDERNAAISPDGRWMAYESNETGQTEVFVRPFPGVDAAVFRISQTGGRSPVWSPAGGELFFVNGTTMYAVSLQLTPTFRYASPVALFDSPSTLFDGRQSLNGGAVRMYDVTRDGRRFVVVKNAETSDPAAARQSIVVVHNWFENAAIPAR